MAVAPHLAARQQFLTKLNEFLALGCERWQRGNKRWKSLNEMRPGERPIRLKVASFLKDQCEDAAYKFWKDVRAGAADAEDYAIRTRRVFDQFMIRIEASKWYADQEIGDMHEYFNKHYWPTEWQWVNSRRSAEERAKLFKELGGPSAVVRIPSDPVGFYEWSHTILSEAYARNDYTQAIELGETIVSEACDIIDRRFADIDVPLALCALGEVVYPATVTRLNCWSNQPSTVLKRLDETARVRVPMAMLDGPGRQLLARFATNMDALKGACARFEADQPIQTTLVAIHDLLGTIRFHQQIRREVWADAGVGVDSTNMTLMLSELLERRADWLREFGLFRSMSEIADFEGRAGDLLTSALGDATTRSLVDDTLAFMREPSALLEQEWKAIEEGEASRAGWNDAAIAGLAARTSLQSDNIKLDRAYGWIAQAKTGLSGCANLLAWSDFYTVCDQYMSARGQPILCDYALNSVRKLQRSAGNAGAVQHYEESLLELSKVRKFKTSPVPKGFDDTDLQWFLREEPPPLGPARR